MRKRLRKKLHKGEFQELGFSFEAVIKENVDDNGFDAWMNELGKLLNQMDLNMIGSVYSGVCGGTITRQQGCVTLKEWELLSAWLREHDQIFDQVIVGKLEDLWRDD
ncbi:50S ribosome-binding protein YggL [Butyricimonas sp. Marseille-P3923]|uniref:50S ribosome-binding protein YggL n=1 Tax=Butyricimonas sp. Marseille-P3923 TaxID=1987504 RepID=UPI000C06EDCB|nr:50S ribosome-binding protein YggL [Butyricimonas sp. Marseille-P3923]